MNNYGFEQLTIEEGGMSIVMEFPKNPLDNCISITQEVKDILKTILFEQLEKVSGGILC